MRENITRRMLESVRLKNEADVCVAFYISAPAGSARAHRADVLPGEAVEVPLQISDCQSAEFMVVTPDGQTVRQVVGFSRDVIGWHCYLSSVELRFAGGALFGSVSGVFRPGFSGHRGVQH